MAAVENREPFLDVLKGLAIITVILGHTLQGVGPNFDDFLPFRLIYAFHMPMFIFASGMVAAIPFAKRLAEGAPGVVYLKGLGRSALRLLVPFFAWAVVSFYFQQSTVQHLSEWLLLVVRQPDNVLWFLWVLFQCHVVLAAIGLGVSRLGPSSRGAKGLLLAAMVLALFLFVGLSTKLVTVSGFYQTRLLLPYFLAGVLFAMWLPAGLPNSMTLMAFAIFAALVPFWHRTEISTLVAHLPSVVRPRLWNFALHYLVGFSGTLAFVETVRLCSRRAPEWFRQAFSFIGRRSLDVYALHFYALGWPLPVIGPLAFALGSSELLRTNPVTSRLFFGEWRGARLRSAKRDRTARKDF